jgi:hypothetical protein
MYGEPYANEVAFVLVAFTIPICKPLFSLFTVTLIPGLESLGANFTSPA